MSFSVKDNEKNALQMKNLRLNVDANAKNIHHSKINIPSVLDRKI
jgi:hypothetical protein